MSKILMSDMNATVVQSYKARVSGVLDIDKNEHLKPIQNSKIVPCIL